MIDLTPQGIRSTARLAVMACGGMVCGVMLSACSHLQDNPSSGAEEQSLSASSQASSESSQLDAYRKEKALGNAPGQAVTCRIRPVMGMGDSWREASDPTLCSDYVP